MTPERRGPDFPSAKRQKVSTACDICRSKKTKCDGVQPVCGPCRSKPDKNVTCTWDSSSARGDVQASKLKILKLQQRVRELEQSRNANRGESTRTEAPRFETNDDSSDVVNQFQATSGPENTYGGELPIDTPSRQQRPRYERSHTSQQEWRRSFPGPLGQESPASAMVGAEEATVSRGFFGSSSAGNFVTQIRKAVARRMGAANTISPTMESNLYDIPKLRGTSRGWRSLSFDECALPPKSRADALMSTYWNAVHPLYPFIDRVVITAQYEDLFSGQGSSNIDPFLLCALNIIFALSCQLDVTVSAERRQSSSKVFFDRAQEMLDLWKMEASIQYVQVLLLLGQYLQSTNEPLQCWVFVGSAIRMAQSLGLHLPETGESGIDPRQLEFMRRVWHACILMDRVLAMTYGRPTMISRAVASASPLPVPIDEENFSDNAPLQAQVPSGPSRLDFFIHSLRLYDILDEVLATSYSNLGGHKNGLGSPTTFNMHAENGSSFIDLDGKLMAWQMNLPEHLKNVPMSLEENESPSTTLGNVFVRQAVVLRQRYGLHMGSMLPQFFHCYLLTPETRFLQIRLLSLRPILSALIVSDAGESDEASLGTDLALRIAHQCSIVCIKVAQEAIDLVHAHRGPSAWATTGLLAAWWYNVLFIYSAATVLVAARLRPLSGVELPHEEILRSWHLAVNILEGYQDFSQSIPRLVATLHLLFEEVPERYLHYRQHVWTGTSSVAGEPLPPLNNRRDRTDNIPPTHAGEQHSLSRVGGVAEDVPQGLFGLDADSTAFGDMGFHFDPTDLSWLNSVPFEF